MGSTIHVIENSDASKLWMLQIEFLESTIHDCLLRPSSIKDTITSIATASLHQIRLASDPTYNDHLCLDQVEGQQKKYPTRRQKEKQLKTLVTYWPSGTTFFNELQKLDSLDYKRQTNDYRNLHSHTIGPRLGIGETKLVKRSIEEAETLVDNGDGTYKMQKIPGRLSVAYSFGGTPPLDINKTWHLNLVEFRQACSCYNQYLSLCKDAVSSLNCVINRT